MQMTGGHAFVEQLLREKVKDVFGIPGIQLDWAVDALHAYKDRIRFIVPRHEQAASYMADGYARTTGREGVSLVVPGPGMLNALTGLATAYACSSRVLFVSGQIPSAAVGRGFGMLHEIPDQSVILKSLTKWHAAAEKPEDIPKLVHEAFVQLRSGHPRPVALEFPPDFFEAKIDDPVFFDAAPYAPEKVDAKAILQAAECLKSAKFPVIFAGGGAVASGAREPLTRLAEILQAPVVMTDNGRGAISDRHPLATTSLGGRLLLKRADALLVVGSRFLSAIATPLMSRPDCRYIYLNVDADHTSAPRADGMALTGDAAEGASALVRCLSGLPARPSRKVMMDRVRAWSRAQCETVQPQAAYADVLRTALPDDGILVGELTQVGYYASIGYPVYGARSYISPGYQGSLGYGFPTALGAAAGNPDRPVIAITGDGGFGWALQELSTARKFAIPLTTIVFTDGYFGNVRRIQRQTFGYEFATELTNPDYAKLADAFGVRFADADSPESLAARLKEILPLRVPSLIAVRVGEMASPWALIHAFVPSATPVPPDPLLAMTDIPQPGDADHA